MQQDSPVQNIRSLYVCYMDMGNTFVRGFEVSRDYIHFGKIEYYSTYRMSIRFFFRDSLLGSAINSFFESF